MDIYIVGPGDDINSIANRFGVSVSSLIQDNGLEDQNCLVEGQALVITYPAEIHIVEEGDSLSSIANKYNVTLMQLLRNNSFLSDREHIFPGESLVIRYNTTRKTAIAGFAYAFIEMNTLAKTLPYLTYLNVINYRIVDEGNLVSLYDTSDIVDMSISYATVPLMGISPLTPQGKLEYEWIYNLLTNESYQDRFIRSILSILQSSGYHGVNILISAINESTQNLYFALLYKLSSSLSERGYELFFTVDPNLGVMNSNITFHDIDYSNVSNMIDGATFIKELWANFQGPPTPITSYRLLERFLSYITLLVPAEKIYNELPLIAYNWELPYRDENANANSLMLDAVMALAADVGAVIQFDEVSQTPFFAYQNVFTVDKVNHIIWFVDVRTFNAMLQLVVDKNIAGLGVWNIMIFYQPLWSVLISQFDVIKLLPEP